MAHKLWKIVDGIKDEMVKEQKDDIVDEMKDNGLWAKTAIPDTKVTSLSSLIKFYHFYLWIIFDEKFDLSICHLILCMLSASVCSLVSCPSMFLTSGGNLAAPTLCPSANQRRDRHSHQPITVQQPDHSTSLGNITKRSMIIFCPKCMCFIEFL